MLLILCEEFADFLSQTVQIILSVNGPDFFFSGGWGGGGGGRGEGGGERGEGERRSSGLHLFYVHRTLT